MTGWIVDVEDYAAQAAERLTRLSEIDPHACRDRVQRLFSKEAMVAGYEAAVSIVAAVRRVSLEPRNRRGSAKTSERA